MTNDNSSTLIIIGIIVAVALLYNYSGFFGIGLRSSSVQYYNEPIEAQFNLTNYTNPSIELFFKDEKIMEFDANDSNQTISFTKNLVNDTYDFYIEGIKEEGALKIVVSEGNVTETKIIDVQQPYIDIIHDIPNTAVEGDSIKINVTTLTPQGDPIESDSVVMDVIYPDNSIKTLTLTKSGINAERNFNYENKGTYQFKIRAIKDGYKTKEYSAVTSVISAGGIHPVVWIWIGAFILFIILGGIKFARTR